MGCSSKSFDLKRARNMAGRDIAVCFPRVYLLSVNVDAIPSVVQCFAKLILEAKGGMFAMVSRYLMIRKGIGWMVCSELCRNVNFIKELLVICVYK